MLAGSSSAHVTWETLGLRGAPRSGCQDDRCCWENGRGNVAPVTFLVAFRWIPGRVSTNPRVPADVTGSTPVRRSLY